jgi:hypothetical protein
MLAKVLQCADVAVVQLVLVKRPIAVHIAATIVNSQKNQKIESVPLFEYKNS